MLINLIDARRGLHDKCLELFANKNIAEQIYRYLCDGIEECEEAELIKHGKWTNNTNGTFTCSVCDKRASRGNYCPNCGAKMDGGEND